MSHLFEPDIKFNFALHRIPARKEGLSLQRFSPPKNTATSNSTTWGFFWGEGGGGAGKKWCR
jgi:hypothetical protein